MTICHLSMLDEHQSRLSAYLGADKGQGHLGQEEQAALMVLINSALFKTQLCFASYSRAVTA